MPKSRTKPDELLRIGEVARALGVSVDTVRRWANAGQIQSTRTLGGDRRFAASEVDRIKNAGTDS